MIKTLYDAPLSSVEYRGKTYAVDLSFDRVLRVFDVWKNEDFDDFIKLSASLGILLKSKKYPIDGELLRLIFDEILPPQKNGGIEKTLDFTQDAKYIFSAFRQAYGIDLYAERGRLHFSEFLALLESLPNNTRLSEIMEIRAKPIPKPTKYNAEERAALIKLKNQYKLQKSEEERREAFANGLQKIAETLAGMAEANK